MAFAILINYPQVQKPAAVILRPGFLLAELTLSFGFLGSLNNSYVDVSSKHSPLQISDSLAPLTFPFPQLSLHFP